MYKESPLRQSPDRYQRSVNFNYINKVYKYKNEWAYLQDLQMQKQKEFVDDQKKLEDEIKKQYRQDLKVSMDQHQQILKDEEYQRRAGLNKYQSLHDRQMNQYHQQRQLENDKISHQCRDFNYNLIEQKRQQQFHERELEKIATEKRIRDAEEQQKRLQEYMIQEKNFVKNELLNANHAQEEIKKFDLERVQERNKQLAEQEFQKLMQQDIRRQQFLDNLQERHYKGMNNPVSNIYLQNHIKQLEDRKLLEKKLVDDYNIRKQQQEAQKQIIEAEQREKLKSSINNTLKNQMVQKYEQQQAIVADKMRYHDYLLSKDKEVELQQNQMKHFQDEMKKEYTNDLKDQIYHKTQNTRDYMDRRELNINKQIFETHGLTPSVPGMFQDHQRTKQLQMINRCMGYQNKIATPENIYMYQNPKMRFQSFDSQYIRSLPSSNKNISSSMVQIPNKEIDNINYSSDQKEQLANDMRRNNSVFMQQGKKLFG